MLEFGEYLPDLPPLLNPGLTRAEGVLPGELGYFPMPQVSIKIATPLDKRPQGMGTARDPDAVGTTYVYVGTEDKLYEAAAGAWTDRSGATYTTATEGRWNFVQWGGEIIATNFDDPIQVQTIGGGNFAALGGTPPQARYIAVVDNFLVVGNTWDAVDLNQPTRVRWAGLGTNTSWTVSSITQASFNDLFNEGGWIMGIVGGDVGIIFQEYAITRMSYIGSPVVFQFDQLETGRGAIAPGGIVPIGNNIAYIAPDGFFVFDGQQSIPIGDGKIDDSFFSQGKPEESLIAIDQTYWDRVNSTLYPNEQIIAWSYPSVNADPVGISDTILFYNYSPQAKTRWSVVRTNTNDAIPGVNDVNHYMLGSPLSFGYTLDTLDLVSTNIDALPEAPPNDISLDSPFWTGQQKAFGLINESLELGFFDAVTYYQAILETGEKQLNPYNRTSITMIRPFIDNPRGTSIINVAMSARDTEQVTASFSNTVTLNSSGFANVRSNGRFQRAQILITGGFTHAEGIDVVQSTKTGRR